MQKLERYGATLVHCVRLAGCMAVRDQLVALGETVPDKQFVGNLLNVCRELSYLRPMLVRAPMDKIVTELTDGQSYHYQDRPHQTKHGNAGRGRFQRQNPRGQSVVNQDRC